MALRRCNIVVALFLIQAKFKQRGQDDTSSSFHMYQKGFEGDQSHKKVTSVDDDC